MRLAFFVTLSLILLFVDARFNYLEPMRQVVSVIIYPLQRLTILPSVIWHSVGDYFQTQTHLTQENAQLRSQRAQDAAQLNVLKDIQYENARLHNLWTISQRVNYPMQLAKIVSVERDLFKRKLFVNKGIQDKVEKGQVVIDDSGVVGQVTRVYPWLSEVTLVTDKNHAVPVQVERNGLRAVVFGSGDINELTLRYMPVSADIQNGDVLITSGIDGLYPSGLPVAKIIKIERDPAYPFSRVACTPLAGVERNRHLLIVGAAPIPVLPPPEESATEKSKNSNHRAVP
jgi:rod shape-determining protein MreC